MFDNQTRLSVGKERYETFYSKVSGKELIQYDYRDKEYGLFSCVATTLEKCRVKRTKWKLKKKEDSDFADSWIDSCL